jgi:hypothetical protein
MYFYYDDDDGDYYEKAMELALVFPPKKSLFLTSLFKRPCNNV